MEIVKFRTIKGKDLYLTLKKGVNGGPSLVVCDKTGDVVVCGFVFCIKENGKLYRYGGVSSNIGICLENGEILLSVGA